MKNLIQIMTNELWYDAISDSTLKPYMWRLHHNGLALWLFFIFIYGGLAELYSAIAVMVIFTIYKLFIQGGGIKHKTINDIKDYIADLTDYSVVWLPVVYPDRILTAIVFLILFILYYYTFKFGWSTPQ